MKYAIGIDPGKTGGIFILSEDNSIGLPFTIPKISSKDVDIRELANIFKDIISLYGKENCTIVLESVHALFGVSSGATFELGKICGVLEGIISALDFKYILVQPKIWQKEMFTGIQEIRKPSKINKKGKIIKGRLDTKRMAEMSYKRLFPDVDVYKTELGNKSKNAHDGLVDAILMAEFCRRKYL